MKKQERRYQLIEQLKTLGFTYEEANELKRIEMTLQRWAELECGTGDDRITRSIERDENEKPFMRVQYATQTGWHDSKYPVADREKGALKRLQKILDACNSRNDDKVTFYHQGDPRGCALYILKVLDVRDHNIDQVYTRGVAVCD